MVRWVPQEEDEDETPPEMPMVFPKTTLAPTPPGPTKESIKEVVINKAFHDTVKMMEETGKCTYDPRVYRFYVQSIVFLLFFLGCAFLLVRKIFGKKRHEEKNKQKEFKGFFGKGGADSKDTMDPNTWNYDAH